MTAANVYKTANGWVCEGHWGATAKEAHDKWDSRQTLLESFVTLRRDGIEYQVTVKELLNV